MSQARLLFGVCLLSASTSGLVSSIVVKQTRKDVMMLRREVNALSLDKKQGNESDKLDVRMFGDLFRVTIDSVND